MAKVRGPLLSMRASGSVGKTQVFASWRGIPYVRMHVVPANPNTLGQQETRQPFAWLNDLYRRLGVEALKPWDIAASNRPMTGRNLCIKNNLPVLRPDLDLAAFIASPGARGGPALATFAAVAGGATKEIDVTWTVGTLPVGWATERVACFAIRDQDSHGNLNPDIAEGSDLVPAPYAATLTMGAAAVSYRVSGWAIYTRNDGTFAVSPSSLVTTNSAA